jgi:cytochrome c oxidase subunit 3
VNVATPPSKPLLLDVSRLPGSAHGADAPVWWGNTLLMAIETMTVALLVATYFYTAQKLDMFPPPRVGVMPPILDPKPLLPRATIDLVLMLVSILPMYRGYRAARAKDTKAAMGWITLGGLIGVAAVILRFLEFRDVHVGWDVNAYGSIVWGILVMHLVYLVVGVAETVFVVGSMALYGLDENLSVDIELTTIYWYWTVGAWVIFYAVVFWTPRLL